MTTSPVPETPLQTDVMYLKGVGPRRGDALKEAGIHTLGDLLRFRPRRYLDHSDIRRINELAADEEVTVLGQVTASRLVYRGRRRLVLRLSDTTGIMEIVWFNQADLFAKIFSVGQTVAFSGKVQRYRVWQMVHPDFDIINETREPLNTGQLIPIYPSGQSFKKAGLSNYQLRKILHLALQRHGEQIPETLPESLRKRYQLLTRREACRQMHFPESPEALHQIERRFKYEELFYLQLLMALRKHYFRAPAGGFSVTDSRSTQKQAETQLPFALTGAQKRVIDEIQRDLAGDRPMSRLVQGDVGSGKTVVAWVAMRMVLSAGFQAALMAPTEILAQQHYFSMRDFMAPFGLEPVLLTGGMTAARRRKALARINSGEATVIIGTHALIQEGVEMERLALTVIDEQHRFGVMQRGRLIEKGRNPHVLVMTATPIPRTLALTVYGDLDVSVIDELPPGRREVRTFWRMDDRLPLVYDFVRQRVNRGEQAYIVYPLIEESEKTDLKAATKAYADLRENTFSDLRLALLHGRLKPAEKETIMQDFKAGKYDILVATTVIEVGVDVPAATMMLIEHAERFGLSQLHQLRGRVGRGKKQSYCVLITPPEVGAVAGKRMDIMTRTSDGFVIAEEDLRIRGSGDFFGTRQHGLPELEFADVITDRSIVDTARKDAFEVVRRDPHLRLPDHEGLRRRFLEAYWDKFQLPDIA